MNVAIVTRNAVHGGVETQIRLQQKLFDAPVFVAGGARAKYLGRREASSVFNIGRDWSSRPRGDGLSKIAG